MKRGSFYEFVLLPDTDDRESQYQQQMGVEHAARLDDHVMHYMLDSLTWVQSENPANGNAIGRGPNLYGPTAFAGDNAAHLSRIFHARATLFECAPEAVILPNSIELPRAELVDTLNAIASLAKEASQPGQWLLHLGI
jgi:hypothetical protein